jgi:uncharacterized membrane protein (DUF106 family)
MKGMFVVFLITILGLVVASAWQTFPVIKDSVHAVLDPSFGALMNLNLNIGFIVVVAIFTLITVLLQKYLTDQVTLKTIKEEQKIIQQEMKLCKENPQKQMELSKRSMELQMKAMPITMRPVLYTTIPFILSFRWFADYFSAETSKLLWIFTPLKMTLFPQWVWAYMIVSIIASIFLRKWLKVH